VRGSRDDREKEGRSLVPLFLEGGAEVVNHFNLDAQRLGAIVNEGVDASHAVSLEDLHLIAMTGGMESAVREGGASSGNGGERPSQYVERRSNPTRRYLYEKYLYRTGGGDSGR
jgi:hypothetical protein